MIANIVKSLLTTLIVSLGLSVIFYFLGFKPVNTFIISICVLLVLGFLVGQISETLAGINNKKLENERIKEFTKQGVSVSCAYCGSLNFTPIRFDTKNQFTCLDCDKKNSIYIDITATQVTNPLDKLQMQIQTINPDEQEAIESLQNE